jgi:hypothetical protein
VLLRGERVVVVVVVEEDEDEGEVQRGIVLGETGETRAFPGELLVKDSHSLVD